MLTAQSEIALVHPLSRAPAAEHLPDVQGVDTIDQFAALVIGWARPVASGKPDRG